MATSPVQHTGRAPFNRLGVRRGNSTGGPAFARTEWAQAIGVEQPIRRMPEDSNDQAIRRERMPYYRRGYYIAPDYGVSWTECGPARPALSMRNVTRRRQQGTDNTRALDPIPAGPGIQDGNGSLPAAIKNINSAGIIVPTNATPHGLHTRVRGSQPAGYIQIRRGKAVQMKAGRQNRLSNSRNLGQSFSQTTIPQGGSMR